MQVVGPCLQRKTSHLLLQGFQKMFCYQCDQTGPVISSGKGKALGMVQGWGIEKQDIAGNGAEQLGTVPYSRNKTSVVHATNECTAVYPNIFLLAYPLAAYFHKLYPSY